MNATAIESALAKLHEIADGSEPELSLGLGMGQAAALLAKIEAADRLASMAEDVRQRFIDFAPAPGDLFAIEALRQEIAAYRNPQPAGGGE